MKLDSIQTLAVAGIALFIGYGIRRALPWLARLNIPAPVIGGLTVALVMLFAPSLQVAAPTFDASLQQPLLIAFFTTVGFSASLRLLRVGGPQVVMLLMIVAVCAVLQNVVGIALAMGFGLPPLFGVLTGSVTLTGGPATGLAFAPLFEAAGIRGADSIAIATAMAGIVLGGLAGGPIGALLISRYRLQAASVSDVTQSASMNDSIVPATDGDNDHVSPTYVALKTFVIVLTAMWLGSGVSALITSTGITLPAYIGAMLVAMVIRNLDDSTRWFALSHATIETLGAVALSLFIVMALMTLDLARLAGLALPLFVILAVQLSLLAALCVWPVFALLGRDYEAAVTTGGFMGFMLGTTANAVAVMRAIVERFGPAPRAFLVAPLVGAFFLDFVNALIITIFLNLLS